MPGFLTNDFGLFDPTDQTKELHFDCASLTTGAIQTLIVPAAVLSSSDVIATCKSNTGSILTFAPGIRFETTLAIKDAVTGYFVNYDCINNITGNIALTPPDASGRLAVSASPLTSGRVPFATTGGLLTDDSDLTFATDTLTATKLVASTSVAVGGGSAITALAAGTYTPTRSAESNLDSNVTPSEAQYLRLGATVTVSGRFTADPTTTLTATSFELTLPIASNIGAVEDCAGVAFCGAIASQGAEITGSVANNTAVISWIASDVTSQAWSYTFTYQVI